MTNTDDELREQIKKITELHYDGVRDTELLLVLLHKRERAAKREVLEQMGKAMTGERCPDFNEDCVVCHTWQVIDDELAKLEKES